MESATKPVDTQGLEGLELFIKDPARFFDMSYTAMHSVPREQLEELQRDGVVRRFAQQRERVPMVAKLADRQGISAIESIEEIVPMLFEHTMYKSYPLALLERQQFDKMTSWISKLTAVDLSGVDASTCDSIDSWLWKLHDEAELDATFSSGTSGTMSFFPWSIAELHDKFRSYRITSLQPFGGPPTPAALEGAYHYVATTLRNRGNYLGRLYTLDQDGHTHLRVPDGYSADMGWLAARLRMAAATGDASRVRVPENLLARRAELEIAPEQEAARERAWAAELKALQGERVIWLAFPFTIHDFVQARLAEGETGWSYDPDSVMLLVGGPKGHTLPDDWRTTVEAFFDLPIRSAYGMVELSSLAIECTAGRYHLAPWIVPMVLDPDTSELLPRRGVQRGRAAYFDLIAADHWGGFITGDEVEVDFDEPCACGATTYHVARDVSRLSDKRGGDDKISCAATPQAHAEAMDFLVGY